jgi:hypothetical protein
MHGNGEWFEERGRPMRYRRWELVDKPRGMDFVALDAAVVWIHAGESNVVTEIVPSFDAEETLPTRHAGLDGYSIT